MGRSKKELLDWEKVERVAAILKSVAHPLRLRIVELLQHGEMTVTEIQEALGSSQSLTSQQLSMMKARGIVKCRRSGKQAIYSIQQEEVIQVIDCLRKC